MTRHSLRKAARNRPTFWANKLAPPPIEKAIVAVDQTPVR